MYSIQIFLYLNYRKRYPLIIEKKVVSTIGIENNENEETKKDDNENNHKLDEETQPSLKEEKPVKIIEKIDS